MTNLGFFEIWSNFKPIYQFGKRYKKMGNLRSITQMGNSLKNSLTEKASEQSGKLVKFSKKIQSKKCDFRFKNMKNT